MITSAKYVTNPTTSAEVITIRAYFKTSFRVHHLIFFISPLVSSINVEKPDLFLFFKTFFMFVTFILCLIYECGGDRTPDRRLWRSLLYQLSYTPIYLSDLTSPTLIYKRAARNNLLQITPRPTK